MNYQELNICFLVQIVRMILGTIFTHLKCPRRIGRRDTQIAFLISLIRAYQIIINDSTKEDKNIETPMVSKKPYTLHCRKNIQMKWASAMAVSF